MSIANNKKRGFTLVELLIVIAILAVLSTATVVVLNPAELLAQARDSQRMQDLASIQTALAFYISQASPICMCGVVTGGVCSVTSGCTTGNCTADVTDVNDPFSTDCALLATRTTAGSGWVDVNLSSLTGGSPISVLPVDPINNTTYFYAYKAENTNKTFELDCRLESQKQRDKMKNDGGDKNTCTDYTEATCYYEVGTSLTQ